MTGDPAGGSLSTGVNLLDSAMGGGVNPGSIVAVAAPPRAQSEPLLYAMAAQNHTRYLSTLRTSEEVTDAIRASLVSTASLSIDVRSVDGDEVLTNPEQFLGGLDSHSLVVIDPATELEQGDRERYRAFLDTCKRAVRMTDSVALLHCHENTPSVLRRDMTLARADQVWDVCVEVIDDNIRTRLGVTKCRGGSPFGLLDLTFDEGGVTADARR